MIVIADDITGAAEMAGIATEQGWQVRLVCGTGGLNGCDAIATYETCGTKADRVTVVATDTRSMTEEEAVAETRHIATQLMLLSTQCPGSQGRRLFKKTDSALRGHVTAEITALMQATGMQRAVYLPANPSKGRTIRGGTYYIDGAPISHTDFSFDPEFPATTSVLRERFPNAEAQNILMPDAESEYDIRHVVVQYDDGHTLFAGAADLFGILLSSTQRQACHNRQPSSLPLKDDVGRLLIVCGSTQSRPKDIDIPVAPMPRCVYDGDSDLRSWDTKAYVKGSSIVLTIPHHHHTGKNVALANSEREKVKATAMYLRHATAEKVKELVDIHRPDHLIIEGGATAWAILQALGWTDFTIEAQLAPGVVQMRTTSGTLVTLKPGSYPWGKEQFIVHR
mgnify:CR=1 FL=1